MSEHSIKLQLQNFRRHEQTGEICFEPGLTIISGGNGAGKSTLIEALLFALFGAKRGRSASNPRTDHTTGELRVECELTIDEQQIKIVRTGKEAELWVNRTAQVQNIPSSLTEVTRQISELLGGLEREYFERTYVALQGDIAGLVDSKAANERRKLIESLLHLDVLSKAVDLQRTRSSEAMKGLVVLGDLISDEYYFDEAVRKLIKFRPNLAFVKRVEQARRFAGAIEKARDEKKALEKAAQELAFSSLQAVRAEKKKFEENSAIVLKMEQRYEQQEGLYRQHQQQANRIAALEGQSKQVRQEIDSDKREIEQAEQCEAASQEYVSLQDELKIITDRLATLPLITARYTAFKDAESSLAQIEGQLKHLADSDEELSQAEGEKVRIGEELERLRTNDPTIAGYEELKRQQSRLDLEEEQNRKALTFLEHKTEEPRCPTCDQPLSAHTSEKRVHHLTCWLKEDLPRVRKDLEQRQVPLDAQKAEWEKQCRDMNKQWQIQVNSVAVLKQKVLTRNALQKQQIASEEGTASAKSAWTQLNEANPPDSQEPKSLQEKKQTVTMQAKALKHNADLFTRLPELRAKLTKRQQNLENLCSDIEQQKNQQVAIGYDPNVLQQSKNELTQARREAQEIQEVLKTVERDLSLAEADLQRKHEEGERAEKNHLRFREAIEEWCHEEQLYKLLDEFKVCFFAINTREVTERTTQLLLHAITDQTILGIQFLGNNELHYFDAAYESHPIDRLSTGEKSLVGLCLRIALAEQAQSIARTGKVRFLFLDEVLSSLDDERCEAVQRIFEDVLQRGIFEHIIMVTHLDTVKQGWRAAGLEVRKVTSKTSKVIPIVPGTSYLEMPEEIEV